ncbi:PIN domain-containing protein [Promicromonospora sp. NPDC060204]|uniref:PIN domain-containing protein n=1 Tax=Promicromonospora sp. NPDC060204 TaxID=3347071 RepID=UPI003653D34E
MPPAAVAPTVLYDANVLYPSTLRDVLIRVGLERRVTPRWTDQILDEVFRNLAANRPDLAPERLARTRALMNRAIPDVLVTGYEHRIESLDLPDPGDRHVLAAAIQVGAGIVVTKNLKDFPREILRPHEVSAEHPDEFLLRLAQADVAVLTQIVRDISATWPDGATVADVLKSLEVEAPRTARAITAADPAL